ncbi:MAG: tetratricopeptide repeat protein [Ignavibacteriales bacterium]|nr:tetratricopeptide repeat protein [Ignavibacteriales bacterium]
MKKLIAGVIVLCAVFVSGLSAQVQIDNAKELLKQGKAKEAIGLVRQVLETAPKNIEAWHTLADAYLKLPNIDSAKIAGQRMISIDEKNYNGYLIVAKIEESQKDIKGAYATLTTGLQEKKGEAQLLIALGGLLLRADSVDRAIVVLSQAKEAAPNSAVIFDNLGDAYNKQGVPSFALTQYEKAVELDSMKTDIYIKLGKLYYKERRYNDAAKAYARVVTLDQNNKEILLELCRMYMASRPKQFDNASKYLKLYTQRFPKETEPWGMYTEALFNLRQFPEALDAAAQVLKADPKNGKALRYQATSLFVLKKYKESIDSFKKLQAVDTMKVDDNMRLGDANMELKQTQAAMTAYEEVLKLDPNKKDVFSKAGMAFMSEGKYAQAAPLFQRRFSVDSSTAALSSYLNYANCKIALKEYDSARVAYRAFIARKADYPAAWIGLAHALLLMSPDSLQRAKSAYEEWLKLIPPAEEAKYKKDLAEAYKNIGVAFLVDKKYEQAIAPLKKSLQYIDNDDDTHLRLGQAYAMTSNKEEAIKAYQKAFKLNPKNKDAKKGLELLGIPVD